MKKNSKWSPLVAAMVLSAVVVGCAAPVTVDKPAQKVVVEKVPQKGIRQADVVVGKISGETEVNVIAKVGGRVAKVNGDIGQDVKAGDPLVVLDDSDFKTALAQSEASLKGAQARLTEAVNGARPQQRIQIDEKVRSAQAKLDNSKKNYERNLALFQSGAVPKSVVDSAESSLIQDEAAYQQAVQDQKLTQEGATQETIHNLQATVDQMKAAVEKAKLDLGNTVITAPVSGKIAAKSIQSGEMAVPNAPLMTIVSSQPVIEVNVPEENINLVKMNQSLKARIDKLSAEVDGVVTGISPLAHSVSKEYLVKLRVPSELPGWKSGMYAEVILSKPEGGTLVVPQDAVVKKGLERLVVVTDGAKAMHRPVATGRSDGTYIEILRGLNPGDRVIVVGQNEVKDGDAVRIVVERGGEQ